MLLKTGLSISTAEYLLTMKRRKVKHRQQPLFRRLYLDQVERVEILINRFFRSEISLIWIIISLIFATRRKWRNFTQKNTYSEISHCKKTYI